MAPEDAVSPRVTLDNCEQEPIHIPGKIQPHGVLMVIDKVGRVMQISANAEEHLGVPAAEAIGRDLSVVIADKDADLLIGRLTLGPLHSHPLYIQAIHGARVPTVFDAIAHRSCEGDACTVVELEPTKGLNPGVDAHDLHRLVQTALAETRGVTDLSQLLAIVAKHVRLLNGFDRVMIYRFDHDFNGKVEAEDRRGDLEPFLGLNYPASDIPPQARKLYERNWLRFIADREYKAAPLVPPTSEMPLDMSHCVLRSVSPIHLEYLRNMGVAASMSISLLKGAGSTELWGLIACHHYSPRKVPFEVRTACELLTQVLSAQIEAREGAARERDLAKRRALIKEITRDMATGTTFSESLTQVTGGLLPLFEAGGAAIIVDGQVTRIGQTPTVEAIKQIAFKLFTGEHDEPVATDHLADIVGAGHFDPVVAGALGIRFSSVGQRAILWFRPERVRTVNWAGDPAKSIVKGEEGVRLSPRGSFALWRETVRGRSDPWTTVDRLAASELQRELLTKLLAHAADLMRSNEDLRLARDEREAQLERERAARLEAERASRMKDDFVATLSHELRTPLNAIQGWTQLLRMGDRTPEAVSEAIEVIERNARVQAQMVEDLLDMSRITSGKVRLDVQPVDLPNVVNAAIDTVRLSAEAKGVKLHTFVDPMHGVTVTGDPNRLQQVAWNLLSNAVKFTPKGGRIRVELRRVGSHVELSINDNGAGLSAEFLPHIFDRFRQADSSSARVFGGLGLGLSIVRHLVEMHGGVVSAVSPGLGQGSTFTVSLPVRAMVPRDLEDNHPVAGRLPVADCEKLNLGGTRVLVVDDEPDARELIRRLLTECGVEVHVAGSAQDGRALIEARSFDLLISDIGMPGEDGYQFVRSIREMEASLKRQRMPAVALTAYARAEDRRKSILAGFQAHVSKPVEPAELLAVAASLTGRL